MAWKDSNRISLSKSILEMKFMKKTKEKVDKQNYQQEGEQYFGNVHLPKNSGRFITEASYTFCEDLIEGRLSYGGENPELERLLELEQMEKNEEIERENEKDVSDIQMAKMWHSTSKINVANMNKRKSEENADTISQSKQKKIKFLKPKD